MPVSMPITLATMYRCQHVHTPFVLVLVDIFQNVRLEWTGVPLDAAASLRWRLAVWASAAFGS